MSEQNLETVRRMHEAWNANDLEAFLSQLHPEVELQPAVERAVEGRQSTYRGHRGVRDAWQMYRGGAFGHLTTQIEELRDLEDSVLVLGRFEVSGATTGLDFATEFGQLIRFRDGKIINTLDFLTHAEALDAAGLSE